MDNNKKYEYVMELPEIREFCRYAFWEQIKYRKGKWLGLLFIIAAVAFFTPEAAVVNVGLLTALLIIAGVYFYRSTVKFLEGQSWTVFSIGGDRLKVEGGSCAEVPFRNIRLIRRTKHLLMLGYMQAVKRPAWFVMPLRVFGDEQEQEAFLAMIRNPQPQTEAGRMQERTDCTSGAAPQEYMRFSFFLDGERWVRQQKNTADIVNGGTFGRPVRTYRIWIWGAVTTVALFVSTYWIAGGFRWLFVCYSLLMSVWLILLLCADPEKRIRKRLKAPEEAARVCGRWQVSLTEAGVSVCMPMNMKSYFGWDSLSWLVETQEFFYLFYKDKKHYIMIGKDSFVSWDQVDAFHRICADHGVQKIAPKKARYVPGWLPGVIFGLIILACVGIPVARIYLDSTGGISGVRMPLAKDPVGAAMSDNPIRVPLEDQVETLASLGLHVPDETVESIRSSMVEYDLYDMVEESPYTWLLMDMGGPSYDEDWNLTGYSTEVFWFDFEGMDIYTDYVNVLNGMLALAQGSPLDSVSDIRENTENMDWENGSGTISVSLNWEGRTYQYDMEVYYDWIDVKVLFIFNEMLEEQDFEKRFYAAGDNGQGAIVFFCTEEWAAEFTKKTGLVLEGGQE